MDVLGSGKCLNFKDNCYDVVIVVGVFILNYVKVDGVMDEMVRVVRLGGLVCFFIREDVVFK